MMKNTRLRCISVLVALLLLSVCASFGFSGAFARTSEKSAFELFTVSGTKSKVEKNATYVASEHQNPTVVDARGKPVVGDGSVTGVKVSLAQGDTFNYTKVIDLTDKTKDTALFEFAITPETIGKVEVGAFEVTLTDAYDKNNYVTINVVCASDTHPTDYYRGPGLINGVGYLRTGANGALAAKDIYWGGVIRVDEGQGAIIFLDFAGIGGGSQAYEQVNTVAKNVMSVYYDDATKQIFTHVHNEYWDMGKPVVDLDDEEMFSEPWEGFTTGECFLSIKGLKYRESAFNFVLTEIDGQNVADVSTDRKPHTITIDTLGFDEKNLPNAVVGKSYPVFEAKSVSPYYGELKVSAKAYYGTPDGKEIEIKNGRFTCAEKGDYYIVYTADDGRGTIVDKSIKITAADEPSPITIGYGDVKTDGYVAGNVIEIPEVTVSNTIGEVNIRKYIKIDNDEIEIEKSEYRFPVAGKYEFVFEATDMVERTARTSFTVSVSEGVSPIFVDEINVPKYFIGGRTYSLPSAYAYNYTDGSKNKIKTKIYATDKNGERVLPTGKFTPATDVSSVKITYDAELNGNHSQKEFVVPVIAVRNAQGEIQADKLFYVESGKAEFTVGETDLTVRTDDDATIDYINAVAADGFSFSFSGDTRFISFKTVTLVLSDAENSAISVNFTYTYESGKTLFCINGGKAYTLGENLHSLDVIKFKYNQSEKTAAFSENVKINAKIEKTIAGEEFAGFPSGKVTASIVIGGVTGGTKISLKQISNQMLGELSFGEFASPVVFCAKDYGGAKAIGSVVTIAKAIAVDAIDPGLGTTLSVFDPDGNLVTANDGTLLSGASGDKDYDITVTKYGSYKVNFSAKDLSGNSAGLAYIIEVVNDVVPEITLSNEMPSQVKVGEKFVLPTASATDDLDGDIEVKIYVMTEQGQFVVINNGAFTCKNVGKYKIYYWCVDGFGNLTCVEYLVDAVA